MNKAIVNMELSLGSKHASQIEKRLSIVDDESLGFPDMNISVFNLLSEKLTHEPVRWKERNQLSDMISFSK